MKIEKPNWESGYYPSLDTNIVFQDWFKENVEPVNKMLSEGVEVEGHYDKECKAWYMSSNGEETSLGATHKALLINIQEIKPKTREEELEECLYWAVHELEHGYSTINGSKLEKAKAILDGK